MKSKKHPNANLEKFSMLFMQLGLVFALFVTYLLIENKTVSNVVLLDGYVFNQYEDDTDETVEIEVEKIELSSIPEPSVILTKPKVIDNDDDNFMETVLKAEDLEAPIGSSSILGEQ